MQTLTIPVPVLVLDPPGGPPAIEKPVTVTLSGLRYPDNQIVPPEDVRALGAFVYRGAPGSEEIWDEKNQVWTMAPADADTLTALTPLPFSPAEDGPTPWKATLVAVGQKDKAGNPRFVKATNGVPVYRLRAFAHAIRNGVAHRAVGTPSPDLQFVSAIEKQRFGVELDTEDASEAGRARLRLKNSSLQQAGYLEIRASGGQEVEIANCNASGVVLARVTLLADGDIRLAPAPGRQIVLEGRLEAQQISYQPQAGGVRQTL